MEKRWSLIQVGKKRTPNKIQHERRFRLKTSEPFTVFLSNDLKSEEMLMDGKG